MKVKMPVVLKTTRSRLTEVALPLLLGVLVFHLLIGFSVLKPSFTAWLARDDMATHYLGWVFFRHGPWQFPLGANPDYGATVGSAIVFSDSLPLFAIPLKIISAWLPEPFQFTGMWLFACFVLQSWFAWKLVGLLSTNAIIRLLATGLLIFSPPLIVRLGGHMTLVGQFVILAGLYLSFAPRLHHRTACWASLLAVTALIHPYLLLMVGALWVTDLVGRVLRAEVGARTLATAREVGIVAATVGVTTWQAGYFMIGDAVALGGFGVYRMNLLSPVDSGGWSMILKDIPGGPGDDEGFNYFGLGTLLLAVLALPALLETRSRIRTIITYRPVLLALLIFLTFLSLSTNVGIGAENYVFPVPIWAAKFTGIFRASGRMFWPVFYTCLFAVLFLVIRNYRTSVAAGLLGFALVVQVIDTSPGWHQLQPMYSRNVQRIPTPLQDRFWTQAASRYKKIHVVSIKYINPAWQPFATFAAEHRMVTDAVYLARMSSASIELAQADAMRVLKSGRFDPEALYILDNDKILLASLHLDPARDLLAKIDGYNVLAPNWKTCRDCEVFTTELKPTEYLARFPVDQPISFVAGGNGLTTLVDGWAGAEPGGIWTDGSEAELVLAATGERPRAMLIKANPFLTLNHPEQIVDFQINNGPPMKVTFNAAASGIVRVAVPPAEPSDPEGAPLELHIRLRNPARPVDLGASEDNRLLGIALVSIVLSK